MQHGASRSVTAKDPGLRVISCGLMFQQVRCPPSRRFFGAVRNQLLAGGEKQHQNLILLVLTEKAYSSNEEAED